MGLDTYAASWLGLQTAFMPALCGVFLDASRVMVVKVQVDLAAAVCRCV